MNRVPPLLVVLLVVAASLGHAKVVVDRDTEVDFSRYITFSWRQGTEASDPLVQKRILVAIERELVVKGYREVRENADLHIVTHISLESETRIDVSKHGYADGYRRWGRMVVADGDEQRFAAGTLVVDLVDSASGALVWRGTASGVATKKPQKSERMISDAVAKLFKKYPPK